MEIHMDGTLILGILTLGIILFLVGLVGKVKAKELEVGTSNKAARITLGILGLGFIILAISGLFYKPPAPVEPTQTLTQAAQETPTATLAAITQAVNPPSPENLSQLKNSVLLLRLKGILFLN